MKHLTIILFLALIICSAQKKDSICQESPVKVYKIEAPKPEIDKKIDIYTARSVPKMAIYPGCDSDSAYLNTKNQNEKNQILVKCFSKRLTGEIYYNIDTDTLTTHAELLNKDTFTTKINFEIDIEGKIVNIKASYRSDSLLSIESIKALKTMAKRVIKKGSIQPAKDEKDNPVRLRYSVPIKFRLE